VTEVIGGAGREKAPGKHTGAGLPDESKVRTPDLASPSRGRLEGVDLKTPPGPGGSSARNGCRRMFTLIGG
jgi:hypothetical protein